MTVLLGLVSPSIAIVALFVALMSVHVSQQSMKVGQRAYLSYEVTITNANQIMQALHTDKDFFLTYQIKVINMGNTPASSIYPKLDVVPDPDRTPVMVSFSNTGGFDLGPKESRILVGQALFKHLHNVRGLPGFSTGITGQIEYKDVFGDSQHKDVCYQLMVTDASASSGMCGTIMQILQIQ